MLLNHSFSATTSMLAVRSCIVKNNKGCRVVGSIMQQRCYRSGGGGGFVQKQQKHFSINCYRSHKSIPIQIQRLNQLRLMSHKSQKENVKSSMSAAAENSAAASSSTTATASNSSSSKFLWPLATAAVVGGVFMFLNGSLDGTGRPDVNSGSVGPVEPQAAITEKVYLDIAIDNDPIGRVVIGLHGHVVPKTARNFQSICNGASSSSSSKKLHYQGSSCHRIIPGFMIQAGDITSGNGMGGMSIYGRTFEDENFVLKHTGPGIVSMANRGKNTQSSQFFITTSRTAHLDDAHVVFGTVVDGWDVVQAMERCGTSSGTPTAKVSIVASGTVLEEEGKEK